MSRPNFVIIQADQLAAPSLPMYGNSIVQTPNLSALANRGTTFHNMYCNNPVCGPSRASMMTGQLSSVVGCYDNAGEYLSSHPTFAHYLRHMGYRTCLSGKMHFVGPDQLHGFEERPTTDIYPSDYGWTADWSQQSEPYSPSVMSMHGIVEAGVCNRSLQIDYDEEVCFHAVRKVYDYARDIDERPFLLMASFTHPHNPFVTQQQYWDLYDHDAINLPSVPHIPVEDRDPWSQRYYYTIRQDEFDVTEEHIRTARHAYYGMISYLDSLVGQILSALADTGQADNTYIFFISDHGDMLGERGMWYKFNPFEWSVRVPLIVAGPGVSHNHVEKRGVSLVDLLPTLVDLADGTEGTPGFAEPIAGRSLAKMLHDNDTQRSDQVFMEYTGEGTYAPCLMLRDNGFKYIYCRTDPPMMFNLDTDPGELSNLAGHSDHADQEARFKSLIEEVWNYDQLEADVLQSQKRRLFVQEALLEGKWTGWDHQPYEDATRAYVRGAIDPNTTATKARRRLPFVETTPPYTNRTIPLAVDLKPK